MTLVAGHACAKAIQTAAHSMDLAILGSCAMNGSWIHAIRGSPCAVNSVITRDGDANGSRKTRSSKDQDLRANRTGQKVEIP